MLQNAFQLAAAVQENMADNQGVYVPPNLFVGQPLRASIDNIDAQVDTTDGKNSFHALASAVYQTHVDNGEAAIISKPLHLKPHGASSTLKDVPKTGVALSPCTNTRIIA